ncbi:MAG: metallophosphoesterase [Hamadaea sp.]|uniref:metallophosphoesterase family protein n=1 Tax=Hamadaea sp. TaxID=2024425 RepID=UPI001850CE87|nr:metallophosphoesterase [Hamadaea sp.]NUR70681.1 metallophosphoesterase [Hamadaea sp.]NUT17868.1 metallophosphoesterase [Hamadaea sp.]
MRRLRVRTILDASGLRAAVRTLGVLIVTLAGVWIGVALGAHTSTPVGPFQATLSIEPTLYGDSEVDIPPLGSLSFDTHDGPAHVSVQMDSLDRGRTEQLISDRTAISRASEHAVDDVLSGLVRLVLRTLSVAILATMALAALVFRRMSRVALCGGLALVVTGGSLGLALATFRADALSEPRYDGLLANAPAVVGDARKIAQNYTAYADQLQKLVNNVSTLYSTLSSLPTYDPAPGTVRVLHISDMHLNPAAWTVVRSVVEQFKIDVVVDTGDINDWGSEMESSYADSIALLKVPYIYIRGNHDSALTSSEVASQPNAIVLENGITTVKGITFAGIGDPRFTPDKQERASDSLLTDKTVDLVRSSGTKLAATIDAQHGKVDVALIHDPIAAGPIAGHCPIILAGHTHARSVSTMPAEPGTGATEDASLLLIQGSTGGAGLRGLESGTPLPLAMSVLYFSAPTGTASADLQAYDDIHVGGTGLAQVSLTRKVAPFTSVAPTPTPTG